MVEMESFDDSVSGVVISSPLELSGSIMGTDGIYVAVCAKSSCYVMKDDKKDSDVFFARIEGSEFPLDYEVSDGN